MKATIHRMSSIPFGAHVFHVPHYEESSPGSPAPGQTPTEFRDAVVAEIEKLAVGTGQMVRALHPTEGLYSDELPLAVIYRGGRAVMVKVGDYIVRSLQFGRDGKAGLVVMDQERFAETFGIEGAMPDMAAPSARPNYPHDVDASIGMSEDVQVREDNGLRQPHLDGS